MSNWAITDYVIEGPKETLQRIYEAILHPILPEDASEGWEGGVLKALNIEWKNRQPDGSGHYMRGFIKESPELIDNILKFYAEEAWGATDFNEVLEEAFPDIKVYYSVEESDDEVYATNDKEGKYFPYRYVLDCCVYNNYFYEWYKTEEEVYKHLSTAYDIKNEEEVNTFNDKCDDDASDDFIHIFKIEVIEK